jgi:hypothetical protein
MARIVITTFYRDCVAAIRAAGARALLVGAPVRHFLIPCLPTCTRCPMRPSLWSIRAAQW